MRDGLPLPGVTPQQVVSQLAHRVLGPIRRDRVAAVLDYHGLAGHPAGTRADVAARNGISPPTVKVWTDRVAAAGARLPLPRAVVTAAMRGSRRDQDHLARTRIAGTLGLAPPKPPAAVKVAAGLAGIRAVNGRAAARAAAHILATVGPLDLDVLVAAVNRQRRPRRVTLVDGPELAAALPGVGARIDETGLWCPPPGLEPPGRYRAMAAIAAGLDLTRHDLVTALTDAGYTLPSAEGVSARHPLIRRIGPDHYRVIGGP